MNIKSQENLILHELKSGTLWITLNRPQRSNAFSPSMYKEFIRILDAAQADYQVKAVIVQGSGKNFCTGNDLKAILELDLDDKLVRSQFSKQSSELVYAFANCLIEFSKPIIACVQGNVIGFMFTAMALFDAVLITQDATFEAPMVKSSQSIEMCGSFTFPRLFGPGRAFEILVLGQQVTAQQAIDSGYAQQIFTNQEKMYDSATQLCNELVAMNANSISAAKRLMRYTQRQQLIEINKLECSILQQLWSSPNFKGELIKYFTNLQSNRQPVIRPKL